MALSPTSSRGGGGGGPPDGSFLPTAAPTGATINTTTYDNEIGSGKYTTLVLPDDNAVLAFAIAGDDYPRLVIGADLNNGGISLGDGTVDPVGGDAYIYLTGVGTLGLHGWVPQPFNPDDIPHTKSFYGAGDATTVTDGNAALLPWGAESGDALLTLTTPTLPIIKTTGTYAVTVNVSAASMTAGGYWDVRLNETTDSTYTEKRVLMQVGLSGKDTLTLTRRINAGDGPTVLVTNRDGAASRDFYITHASVQRLA